MVQLFTIAVLGLGTGVVAQTCPLQFEGRVHSATALTDFDGSSSLYNPGYVLGAG